MLVQTTVIYPHLERSTNKFRKRVLLITGATDGRMDGRVHVHGRVTFFSCDLRRALDPRLDRRMDRRFWILDKELSDHEKPTDAHAHKSIKANSRDMSREPLRDSAAGGYWNAGSVVFISRPALASFQLSGSWFSFGFLLVYIFLVGFEIRTKTEQENRNRTRRENWSRSLRGSSPIFARAAACDSALHNAPLEPPPQLIFRLRLSPAAGR